MMHGLETATEAVKPKKKKEKEKLSILKHYFFNT